MGSLKSVFLPAVLAIVVGSLLTQLSRAPIFSETEKKSGAIDRGSLQGTTEVLYTVDNGLTSWWNLRLHVAVASGSAAGGAVATLKVNGQDIPDQRGAIEAAVDPSSAPERTTSVDALLSDGDVISVVVAGPSTVDVSLSGDVSSEQL